MRLRCIAAVGVCCAFGASAHGQTANTPAKALAWDVISVKPMSPDACPAHQGGVGWLTDGLTASCVPAGFVIQSAYHLFDASRIVGLPEWAKDSSQVYAIEARVSGEDAAAFSKLSREEKLGMMQSVLAERFRMKSHMEPREMPAYDLVVAKGGPKLKEPAPGEIGQSQFGTPTGEVKLGQLPTDEPNVSPLPRDRETGPRQDRPGG